MSFNLGSAHGEIVIDYNGAGVQQAMGDLTSLSQQGTNLLRAGAGVTAFGAAIGGALLGATNQAADFQFQMDAVNAALGGLDAGPMEAVTQQALDLGAATKFSAGEVAGVQEQLAKMGLSADQVTAGGEGATKAVLDLASATGEQLAPAATAVGAALNLFQLDASQTADVADILTAALNESSATLPDLQRGINNLGPVFANLNRYVNDGEGAFRDTAAAVAYFNSLGLKAADAGLSIARGMTDLATPTSKASEEMAKLGISAFDLQGNMLPLPELMDQLNKGMADMSDQDRIAALSLIFGAEAADVMNDAIKHGGDGLRQYEKDTEAAGQAAEQAAIRQDNLRGALENLGGSIQTAAIALGTPFLGPLQEAAQALTNLVNVFIGLPPEVQAAIAGFAALASAILLVGGGAITAAGAILRFGPAFAAAFAAAAPFLAIMAAIGAAIGIGILAYKTDFLGFGQAVNKALAEAGRRIHNFGSMFDSVFNRSKAQGMNDLAAGVRAFGFAIDALLGTDVSGFFDRMATAVQAFGDAIQENAQNNVPLLVSVLDALGAAAESLGFTGVADALQNAALAAQQFGDTIARVSAINQAAGFSDLASFVSAFGVAVDQLLGTDLAPFFDNAAKAIQVFGTSFATARADGLDPFSAALIALRDTVTQVTGIDLTGFFDRVGTAAQGAVDALGNVAGTIRDVAGAIKDGNFQGASDILMGALQALSDFAQEALSSIDIQQVAINVLSWVQGKWDDLKAWIESQTGVDLGSIDIPSVVVNILGWIVSAAPDIGSAISEFVAGITGSGSGNSMGGPGERGESGTGSAGVDIGQVAVKISGWLVSAAQTIGEAIQAFLGLGGGTPQAGLGGTGVGGIDLGTIAVNVSDWVAGTLAPVAGLAQELASWLQEQLQVSDEFVTMAGDLGRDLGTKVGNALVTAINEAMSAAFGGGGGPTSAGMASGAGFGATMGASLGDAFANFDSQFTAAVEAAIEPEIEQAKAALGQWFAEKRMELWQSIWDSFLLAGGPGSEASNPNPATGGTGGSENMIGMIGDWLGEHLTQNAGAAALDPKVGSTIGEQFGQQFATVLSSPEFTSGLEKAMTDLPPETFAGVGTSLLGKISEAISTSMQVPKTDETTGAPTGAGDAMGAQLVQNIASGLQTAIDSAPAETFTAIGTSLISKIQGAISAAMTTASTQGQQGPVGEGAVGGMGTQLVTGLATSIAAAITAAPIESFAEVGTALSVKLQEVLSTALSAGAGAGRGQGAIGTLGGAQGGGIGTQIAQSIATAISGADFASVATALQTSLGTAVTTAIQQVSTVISTATNVWITTFITTFAAIAQSTLSGMAAVAQSVQAGLSVISTSISTWTNVWITTISTTVAAMQASLDGFASSAAAAGQTAGQGFSDGLTSGMAAAQAAAQAAVDAIIAILQSAAAGAEAAGAAVGEGFAAGMEASLGRVQAAAAAMADAAAAGLAAAAQIASPSKVSMALGDQFAQGFELGLAGGADKAAQASFDLGQDSIRALADSLRSNADARVTRLRNLGDNIRENQGLASGSGQPTTIETTGTVELDGEQMGTFTVETVLGGLIGAQRKGGKRRGRMQ